VRIWSLNIQNVDESVAIQFTNQLALNEPILMAHTVLRMPEE